PLAFLCLPPLVYAAFRFGQREAATCVALLAGLAIVGALAGHGPVARDSQNESLLLLQAFMMTLTIVTLPLAAIVREHGRSEAALAQSAASVAFSDDAIIGKRLDGGITTLNEGAQRLYGYTSAEAVGRPISLLIPPALADQLPGRGRNGAGPALVRRDRRAGAPAGRRDPPGHRPDPRDRRPHEARYARRADGQHPGAAADARHQPIERARGVGRPRGRQLPRDRRPRGAGPARESPADVRGRWDGSDSRPSPP